MSAPAPFDIACAPRLAEMMQAESRYLDAVTMYARGLAGLAAVTSAKSEMDRAINLYWSSEVAPANVETITPIED